MRYFLLFTLLLFSFGCETLSGGDEVAQSDVFYKRDLKITHNGKDYFGAAVLPNQESYNVRVDAYGKIDLFTWTSCHMEHTQEDAGEGGIFSSKNKLSFNYRRDFSGDSYCPVEVGTYSVSEGKHGWFFLDFESDLDTLPATLYCNGYVYRSNGVSVCQSKKELTQKIVFQNPVLVEGDDDCPQLKTTDDLSFEYPTGRGFCVYAIKEIGGLGRYHRLTTIGYDKILIREVQK